MSFQPAAACARVAASYPCSRQSLGGLTATMPAQAIPCAAPQAGTAAPVPRISRSVSSAQPLPQPAPPYTGQAATATAAVHASGHRDGSPVPLAGPLTPRMRPWVVLGGTTSHKVVATCSNVRLSSFAEMVGANAAVAGASHAGDEPCSKPAAPVGAYVAEKRVEDEQCKPAAPALANTAEKRAEGGLAREQALEQKVRELQEMVEERDECIKVLSEALSKAGTKPSGNLQRPTPHPRANSPAGPGKKASRGRSAGCEYRAQYSGAGDPIDVRLAEAYNAMAPALPIRRINCGFYRIGDMTVELKIINKKLMARNDEWNHGKFGPIEKLIRFADTSNSGVTERQENNACPDGLHRGSVGRGSHGQSRV